MIVTHSNKFLIPKSKIVGGILNSALDIPEFFISSNHVSQSKKYWANPSSAAYYKEAKEMAEKANKEGVNENCFPDFIDGFTKQLHLKTNDGYIVHSPLASCALVDEFTTKARAVHRVFLEKYLAHKNAMKKNRKIRAVKFFGSGFFNHQIQPRGVTLGNRGELAVNHGGCFFIKAAPFVGLFKQKKFNYSLPNDRKFLYFYGSLDNANFNSGFISSGLPAITAIGGMIESVELKLNYDKPIPFAFGLKNHHMSRGGKLSSSFGKDRRVVPLLVCEEKTGSLDFVIVLDVTDFESDNIKNELMKISRLAGGSIFNYKITTEEINEEEEYFFIRKYTFKMRQAIKSGDVINYIITRRLHPLACGYALLQKPCIKHGVRVGVDNKTYNHAFSETLFLPVRMSKRLDYKSFFQRKIYKNCTAYV